MSKKQTGYTNRRKGHNAERYYAKLFKDLGFEFCVTARLGSRLYDNAKIDLINLPFNVQIKAGMQKSMNAGKELFNMKNMIIALFPPEDDVHKKPCFLIHKKDIGRGNERRPEHELVYMSRKQFEVYQVKDENLKPHLSKEFKYDLDSEFKSMVAITFETFKNKILIKHFLKE